MAEYNLHLGIIRLSENPTWELAKREWDILNIYDVEGDEPETCLCGHHPIIEVCELVNRNNGNTTIVGNHCVNKFLDLPSELLFSGIRRIKENVEKSLNAVTINHALDKKWVTKWEYDFYLDIFRKRKLTEKQANKKREINERILKNMKRTGIGI